MISWQLAFPKELPFLIGYWIWIAAVAIALWIVTLRLIEIEQIDLRAVLGDRFSQTLFLTPVLNAVVVGSSDLLA